MACTAQLPMDDLRQIGSIGLLRAIEAFAPERGRSLSSFAVPYIRGAIQHELRDRYSLMRIPRDLWELRRRASTAQERRRRRGEAALAPAQLAELLACSPERLIEALNLNDVMDMRSLDAPAPREGGGEAEASNLLDLLADPRSLNGSPCPGAETAASGDGDGRQAWMRRSLEALAPLERTLLLGHICWGQSWAELGRDLGLHPRQAQRRTLTLMARLLEEGRRRHPPATGEGRPG